jgi:hypothetical protein
MPNLSSLKNFTNSEAERRAADYTRLSVHRTGNPSGADAESLAIIVNSLLRERAPGGD